MQVTVTFAVILFGVVFLVTSEKNGRFPPFPYSQSNQRYRIEERSNLVSETESNDESDILDVISAPQSMTVSDVEHTPTSTLQTNRRYVVPVSQRFADVKKNKMTQEVSKSCELTGRKDCGEIASEIDLKESSSRLRRGIKNAEEVVKHVEKSEHLDVTTESSDAVVTDKVKEDNVTEDKEQLHSEATTLGSVTSQENITAVVHSNLSISNNNNSSEELSDDSADLIGGITDLNVTSVDSQNHENKREAKGSGLLDDSRHLSIVSSNSTSVSNVTVDDIDDLVGALLATSASNNVSTNNSTNLHSKIENPTSKGKKRELTKDSIESIVNDVIEDIKVTNFTDLENITVTVVNISDSEENETLLTDVANDTLINQTENDTDDDDEDAVIIAKIDSSVEQLRNTTIHNDTHILSLNKSSSDTSREDGFSANDKLTSTLLSRGENVASVVNASANASSPVVETTSQHVEEAPTTEKPDDEQRDQTVSSTNISQHSKVLLDLRNISKSE
ncbi:hypothetical protein AB6A40_002611 [Gnathostoma spinigerum]|uniref:Uncharacterized protein n=1 Tax=Gnathostoma spinigerum TaxID=75299 RepID=A0ABD6EGU5_9BILA